MSDLADNPDIYDCERPICMKRMGRLLAENEKLRAELARIREMPRVQTLLERDALKAEVQRLRGELDLVFGNFAALQATESETSKP